MNDFTKNMQDQFRLFEDAAIEMYSQENGPQNSPSLSSNTGRNLQSSLPSIPATIENLPSAINYVWKEGKIIVGPNSANIPIFPSASAQRTHGQLLETCAAEATNLLNDIRLRRWQIRQDYEIEIGRYLERLPLDVNSGNILLADATARTLREIFQVDRNILPAPFAARLKILLEQHIALRPFYPEISQVYLAMRDGRIEDPLPLDAVSEIISVVEAQTPAVFDESVLESISEVSLPKPQDASGKPEHTDGDAISPPSDPLGEVDPHKFDEIQTGGVINRLLKVFKLGESLFKSTKAWVETYYLLAPPAIQILNWLRKTFLRSD